MSNMVIKLKIPNGAPFVCPTCNKSFTTGKGLGGHKRVHMENKNKRNHESMELQIGENGEKTLVPNSCPVCHQTYGSEKALHGHMRKHPNRGWRGMIPPPPPPPPPPVGAEAPLPSQANISLALPQSSKSVVGENPSLVNGDSDKTNVKEEKEFLCDICCMVFSSYHALGGHKSHHRSVDVGSTTIYMEQPEGFVGVDDQGQLPVGEGGNDDPSSSQVFGFDLNELPPEVDD